MTAEHPRPLRVAIGSLVQETNSFSPIRTTVDTFRDHYLLHGDEVLTGWADARVEVPGALGVLRAAGITPLPLIAAHAAAAGPVTREAFDSLVSEMEDRLRAALPVDGLILSLHGSLVVEDAPDGEAEIIARMRAILPPGCPIGVSLDLHGHITPAMLQPDVFHIGYREYPHIDMFETGVRTAELMVEVLTGRCRPVMALAKAPVVVPAVDGRTTDGPMAEVAAAARRAEKQGRVLHASIFPVQPWIDVPDLGFAALVCGTDAGQADAVARELAQMVLDRRDAFDLGLTPLDQVIATGMSQPGMTLVSDTGDAPTGGSAADSAAVLRGLIAAGADGADRPVLVSLCDPAAATAAHLAGPGAVLDLSLGHAISPGEPVAARVTVVSVSNGTYAFRDAGARGMEVHDGPSAVLAIGAIRIAVRSRPSMEWDTGLYLSQGLDPATACLCFVKSPSHFRVAFGPLSARILLADTPGPTSADIRRLPYTRITRPLHPFDAVGP